MKGTLEALASLLLFWGPLRAEDRLHRIPSAVPGARLMLRQGLPRVPSSEAPVLILHGATFPSSCAAAWKGEGGSWMEAIQASGREAWALDFLGYGGSDRYPESGAAAPQGDLPGLVDQVRRAVEHVRATTHAAQVDLVAHSAGTLVAGRFAELHPTWVRRLVLFGAPGPQAPQATEPWAPTFLMRGEDQWNAWEARVKDSGRWSRGTFEGWASDYLASDPTAASRTPPSVRVPSGLMACISELERTGELPYRPEALSMPTLLILGEWDGVTLLSQSLEIFRRLPSPQKRLTVMGQAGHRMHLEAGRQAFFAAVNAFLSERAQ